MMKLKELGLLCIILRLANHDWFYCICRTSSIFGSYTLLH